jgi:S1-C subfamily serine protease
MLRSAIVEVLCVLLVAIVLGGCKGASESPTPRAPATAHPPGPPPPAPGSASPIAPLSPSARTEDERNTIGVFKHAAPSTVFVTQHRLQTDWFGGRALEQEAGSGSGFVWDKQGHIVTNFHVIQGARRLTVTLHDHRSFPAVIRGVEPRKDIAVLRVEAPADALVPIQRAAEPPTLDVGQKVVAIGNPFGLDQTLTTGIVSALGREVDGAGGVKIRDMIQTDAAINPGNSGGPLLDSAGQLIGMNTAIYSRSGAWAGIGFAVPATTIYQIVPQIVRAGRVEQVGIGVNIDPNRRLERRFGIRGVVVLGVVPGTPAEKAGLQGATMTRTEIVLGDVIVGINGQRVTDYDGLYRALDGRKAGERVKVELLRAKATRTIEMDLIVIP